MARREQFIGQWVHWDDTARIEQQLFADGRFEGVVFDEEAEAVFGKVSGTWEMVGDAIHWRYLAGENIDVPKKVDVNTIVRVDENRFDLREPNRRTTDWHRAVKSEETSTNFDYDDVQPFLQRIAPLMDSGFGNAEIATLMKKMQKLRPDQSCQMVFPVKFKGTIAPFRIRVFMDDVDAPDISFYGPVRLTQQIDQQLSKL